MQSTSHQLLKENLLQSLGSNLKERKCHQMVKLKVKKELQ